MTTPRADLKNMPLAEIAAVCAEVDLPPYKARQVFSFVHQKFAETLDAITTLTLEERMQLKARSFISVLSPQKKRAGRDVVKVTFKLEDGAVVEAVLMKHPGGRDSVCVSSQAGCPVKCGFCATGRMAYRRNLTAAEILSQVYYFAVQAGDRPNSISNVLFMGMGEPFLNYANVLKAAKILNHQLGLNIAARKIVFSTVGIVDGVQKLANEREQFRLAWSLASPFDNIRRQLIFLKSLPTIAQTVAALQSYQKKCGRRITIEYVVLGGVNDNEESLKELVRLSRKIDCNVNLIPYNPSAGLKFASGNTAAAEKFLTSMGVNAVVRKSFGGEISAACGQLAGREGIGVGIGVGKG
jgi:23S rRNA (adenine2503-C2)-methyltransferase